MSLFYQPKEIRANLRAELFDRNISTKVDVKVEPTPTQVEAAPLQPPASRRIASQVGVLALTLTLALI